MNVRKEVDIHWSRNISNTFYLWHNPSCCMSKKCYNSTKYIGKSLFLVCYIFFQISQTHSLNSKILSITNKKQADWWNLWKANTDSLLSLVYSAVTAILVLKLWTNWNCTFPVKTIINLNSEELMYTLIYSSSLNSFIALAWHKSLLHLSNKNTMNICWMLTTCLLHFQACHISFGNWNA